MENRFGFKDFVLATLVILLIVVVLLGMRSLDRQWELLETMSKNSETQTRVLAQIYRQLNETPANAPSAVTPATPPTTNPSPTTPTTGPTTNPTTNSVAWSNVRFPHGDPFANIKEAEKQPDFARGDWIVDNFAAKLKNATYPIASDLYSAWLQARVLEGLIYRDPSTLEYRPQLARDWHVSDDGMVLTFRLRRGVMFSDGVPVTADDVVYSFDLLMNPKINCPRLRGYLENIKDAKKTSEDEVVFTMKTSYYESLDLCGTLSIIPKHFYEKLTAEQINTNPGLLIGTGPYKMVDPESWRPGDKIQVVRNDLYWGATSTFDRCIFLEVEEEAAEETMFGNGELDVFATQPEQFERLLHDPRTAANADHYEYESPMNGYAFIAWNEKRNGKDTLFTNPKVRKAMTMLTDRARICHDIFMDFAKPTSGPFAMNSPQADASIKPLPFNVSEARRLLAEVGFEDRDGSGVLKNTSGTPFTFRLTYGSGNATFERVVLYMKDSFAQAGVTLVQDPVDWPILQKDLDQRNFDAITLQWSGVPESDLYQEFDSSQMVDEGDNFMSYANPKLDAVLRKARETVDASKRMPLWHEAHAILNEDQPYTFLFSRMSLRFMANRIKNVRQSKLGLNYVYVYSMPNPWYVPEPLQRYTLR